MTNGFDVAAEAIDSTSSKNADTSEKCLESIISLSDDAFVRKSSEPFKGEIGPSAASVGNGMPSNGIRGLRRMQSRPRRRHADDLLSHANYNDEPDPAVKVTVEKLVDTSKVIELERIDLGSLPKKRVYRFVKRAFDIVSCLCALVICAIPMGIIAIMVKRDSPGPVLYRQERLGWSIIGQKSGAAFGMASRPALSALEAWRLRHSHISLGVAA